jgi:hypothetical protein
LLRLPSAAGASSGGAVPRGPVGCSTVSEAIASQTDDEPDVPAPTPSPSR